MRNEPANMSSEAMERLGADLESRTDFRGLCVSCGVELTGTLLQMREHRCKEEPDASGK